jgi:hypothetical protein
MFVQENHHVKLKCNISCPDNVILCPGSMVITKWTQIMEGVYLEGAIIKVMRNNRIFVVVTNTNPYPICLKQTQSVEEVIDTVMMKILPIHEASISPLGIQLKLDPSNRQPRKLWTIGIGLFLLSQYVHVNKTTVHLSMQRKET